MQQSMPGPSYAKTIMQVLMTADGFFWGFCHLTGGVIRVWRSEMRPDYSHSVINVLVQEQVDRVVQHVL